MGRHLLAYASLLSALVFVQSAGAQTMITSSLDGKFRLKADYGLMSVGADEVVYTGNRELSHLFWNSWNVHVLSASAEMDFYRDWTAAIAARFGFGGNGSMQDYDWQSPYYTDNSLNGWSDRSLHPDNRIDQYFEADASLRRDLMRDSVNSFGLTAGAKYTQIQWSAHGGTYVQSSAGVRDTSGTFADTTVITFRQMMPVAYVGFNASHITGNWTLDAALQAGVAIGASDVDNHWLRNLRFEDSFGYAPVLSATVSAEYRWAERMSVYASAKLDRMFTASGDIRKFDTNTGTVTTSYGAAGLSYYATTVSLGVKGQF